MNFTDSPYEHMMKETPHKEASAPQKAPEGTPCAGCSYWRGIMCVFCYREHLKNGNVKKCAVGKHPKSEKHGNTAQFSGVERSGTQENCGGAGQAAVCACAHSRYFAGGSPSGLRV